MSPLSNDAKAIALPNANLERNPQYPPLTQAEYSTLASWLVGQGMTPASLLDPQVDLAQLNFPAHLEKARLSFLLSRGVVLGMVLEELTRSGIELCCRSDSSYPGRYKERLAGKAPALFYYAGNLGLVREGGLAVVGSRNLDFIGEEFSRNVGKLCANHGMTVISGGARGVDSIAMLSALEMAAVQLEFFVRTFELKAFPSNFESISATEDFCCCLPTILILNLPLGPLWLGINSSTHSLTLLLSSALTSAPAVKKVARGKVP